MPSTTDERWVRRVPLHPFLPWNESPFDSNDDRQSVCMSTVEDGWDDDDGFFGSDDDDATGGDNNNNNNNNNLEGLTAPTTRMEGSNVPVPPTSRLQPFSSSVRPPTTYGAARQPAIPASTAQIELSENASDGWGDDEDALRFDDDDDQEQPFSSLSHPAPQPDSSFTPRPTTGSGPSSSPEATFVNTVDDPLYQDLVAYLGSLEQLSRSINAILEAEYNESQDKAVEILEYYRDRPGLAAYTVDKELSRMEYVVTIPPSTTITDKTQIADLLRKQEHAKGPSSLLARSANQSILADLLQACTGHDRLVRPQFMASAAAQACQFHLDFLSGRLHVQAHLSLSIPTATGRWEVAQIVASIEFVPHQHHPSVRYRLENVQMLSSSDTDPLFRQRATSALELLRECLHEHPPGGLGEGETTDVNFRDMFLQQSQNILLNSADGMQSAWKEFEQVAGIKSKLMNLPGFLPDDVLHAAEKETFTMQAEQHEKRRQQNEPQEQQRPKSILGGLVRSGFKKLAQQVALPTEDPSLYEDWSSPATHPPTRPSVVASHPSPFHQAQQNPQLQLYNMNESPPPKAHSQNAPPSDDRLRRVSFPKDDYQSSTARPAPPDAAQPAATGAVQSSVKATTQSFGDGWGDEEDDLFEIEEPLEDVADVGRSPTTVGGRTNPVAPMAGDASAKSKPPAERPRYLVDESKQVPPGWTYDPTTGIIPTRKRWLNPCPDPFPS
jgi:hypothetical protein